MTNKERQEALERKRKKFNIECGQELYCKQCRYEQENACAKAYNRMIVINSNRSNERDKHTWGDW